MPPATSPASTTGTTRPERGERAPHATHTPTAVTTPRREAIARAALTVLATVGGRGLTHRAVDVTAGLSPGSSNYHAPNRERLLILALEQLFADDVATSTAFFAEQPRTRVITKDAAATVLAALVTAFSSHDAADRLVARHELLCEAQHRPALRAAFDEQRAAFVALTRTLLKNWNCTDLDEHADTLTAGIDGLMQRQVLLGERRLSENALKRTLSRYLSEC